MQSFLDAIHAIEFSQYLKINIHNQPPEFGIFQLRIWNHGLKFRGLIYHRTGKEIMHSAPMTAQDMVSIITYLCISRDNASLRLIDEPFMPDLNREWYFIANPSEASGTTGDCESCPSDPIPDLPPAAFSNTSKPDVLVRSQHVCPVCQTHLTLEHFVPAHGRV